MRPEPGAERQAGRRGRRLAAAGLLLISLVGFHDQTAFLFEGDPEPAAVLAETFSSGVVERPEALESRGFLAGPEGWYLPPRTTGRIDYSLPQSFEGGRAVFVFPYFHRPSADVQNALSLSRNDGTTLVPLEQNAHLLGTRIDLSPHLSSGGAIELVFEASNGTDAPTPILERFQLLAFSNRPEKPPTAFTMTLALVSFGLVGVLLSRIWRQSLLVLGILALGFVPRYLNFQRVLYSPLDPDAEKYRSSIEQMTLVGEQGFYSADMRAPVFLLVGKAFFLVFGPSDSHLRLLSLFLSILVIYLVYLFVRELAGREAGLAGALIVAVDLPLVFESGRGLRLELEMVLLLLLAGATVIKKPRAWWSWVSAGAWGGMLLLARFSHAPVVLMLILAGFSPAKARWTRTIRGPLIALGVVLLLALPHRLALFARHGDPLWDMKVQARGFANQEFAGSPGFPSRQEIRQDLFTGPPLDLGEYLLTLHSPREVIVGVVRGIGKITARMDLIGYRRHAAALLRLEIGWVDAIWKALGILGLFAALTQRGRRWLPLTFTISLLPVALLYDLGLLERYRLTLHAFPFFLTAGLLLAQRGVRRLGRRLAGRQAGR